MPRRRAARALKHGSLWMYRLTLYVLVGCALLVGSGMLAVRYWLMPNIGGYTEQISQAISRAANQRIVIGSVLGDWNGLRPRLILRDVRLYDRGGQEQLALDVVDSTLSWASVVALEPRFYSIELTGLSLEIRRDAAGELHVAGIALTGGDDPGLTDWLLKQFHVALHDSDITWVDETLGGAPLALKQVEFRVDTLFGRHRFGLRAVPPLEVAAPLDLRGDLHGNTLRDLGLWSGQLFFQVGYADLAALQHWLPLPLEVERGAGGLQVWMDVAAGRLRSITADVGLSDVRTRLRPDLPELELERLLGRLGWSSQPVLLEFWAKQLSFTTPDGLRLAPADLSYTRTGAPADPTARYDVQFDALDLAAVTRLVDRLPLEQTLRSQLSELQPRGMVRAFRLSWSGNVADGGEYSMKGGFDGLAVNPSGYVPGFAAVSGKIDATQHGGTLDLYAGASTLNMPRVFLEPLPLESLSAQVAWSMSAGLPLVHLENVTFSSAHLNGSVTGSYQAVAGGPGRIDLVGGLEHAQGSEAWRYIPLVVHPDVRDWLHASIAGGEVREVRFTLRGELQHFPWGDGQSGLFEVAAKLDAGALSYAPGWPSIEGINGRLSVRGHLMTVNIDEASVFGAKLAGVTAVVPDLGSHDPQLQLRGEAEGSTADFLRFVEHSPIDKRINGFGRGVQTSGRGRLALSLDVPLKHSADTQVSGRYRFSDNTMVVGTSGPRLEQVGGVLAFTQEDASLREGSARVFGMPARFTAERKTGGGVVVRGGGRAELPALGKELSLGWMNRLSGSADWTATIELDGQSYALVAESDLRGLASSLPRPLAKPASSSLALRIERRSHGPDQELLAFSIADLLSGQMVRTRDDTARVLQAEFRLGAHAPEPGRPGVWLAGHTDYLDLDRWRALLEVPGGGVDMPLAGIDLVVDDMYAFSRDWREVSLQARRTEQTWQAVLNSRAAVGSLTWSPERLSARFSRLHVPTMGAVMDVPGAPESSPELPSLDVVAEDFWLGERDFGRLTLAAARHGGDWRIETLDLRCPEGHINMSGTWQAWSSNPTTKVDVRLEASDVGRYFARLRLPEGLKSGSARVQGQLTWNGPPYSLDLPSLGGSFSLEASKGQFVRVEPGIGKLIGVVSLQALPRRVALDFRDVFSEGFPFEEIRSTGTVERGVVRTGNFRMEGSAARVEMKGELDLGHETQHLHVKVVPSLSEGVALGAAIVNPAVGLATLFAQKALKDPINQMVSFEYDISGTWADPVVVAKKREQAEEGKQGRK